MTHTPPPPPPAAAAAAAAAAAGAGNCLRLCTSGSAQWRLRPPAADLWGDHEASWRELHLMNVLLGSVLLHRCVLCWCIITPCLEA